MCIFQRTEEENQIGFSENIALEIPMFVLETQCPIKTRKNIYSSHTHSDRGLTDYHDAMHEIT